MEISPRKGVRALLKSNFGRRILKDSTNANACAATRNDAPYFSRNFPALPGSTMARRLFGFTP